MLNRLILIFALILSLLSTPSLSYAQTPPESIELVADLGSEQVDEWSFSSLFSSFSSKISSLWSGFTSEEEAEPQAVTETATGEEPAVAYAPIPEPRPSLARLSTTGPRTNNLLRRLDRVQMCMGVMSGNHLLNDQLQSDELLRSFMLCPLADAFNADQERIELEPSAFCSCVSEKEQLHRDQGIGVYERLRNPAQRANEIRAQVVAPALISTLSRYDELLPQISYALSAIEFRESVYHPTDTTAISSSPEDLELRHSSPLLNCQPHEMLNYFDSLVEGADQKKPVCSQKAREKLMGAIAAFRECQGETSGNQNCMQAIMQAVLNDDDRPSGVPAVEELNEVDVPEESRTRVNEISQMGGSCSVQMVGMYVCQSEANTAYSAVTASLGVGAMSFLNGMNLPSAANLNRPLSPLLPAPLESQPQPEPEAIAVEETRETPDFFRLRAFHGPTPEEISHSWEEGRAFYHTVVTDIVQHMLDHKGDTSAYEPRPEHLELIRQHIVRNPHLRRHYPVELINRIANSEQTITWNEIASPYLREVETKIYERLLVNQFGEERARSRDYPGIQILPDVVLLQGAFSAIETTAQMTSSCIQVQETLGSLCHALDDENSYGPITSLTMSEPLLETLLSGTDQAEQGISSEMAEQYHQLMIDSSLLLCAEHNTLSGGGTREVAYEDPLHTIRDEYLADLYSQRLNLEREIQRGAPSAEMRRDLNQVATLEDSSDDTMEFVRDLREQFFPDPRNSSQDNARTQSSVLATSNPTAVELPSESTIQASTSLTNDESATQSALAEVAMTSDQVSTEFNSLNPETTSLSAQDEKVNLERERDMQEREELVARLEETEKKENELRQRMKEIEANAQAAQATAQQQKLLQDIVIQLEQLRLENEKMRQRIAELPERAAVESAIAQDSPTDPAVASTAQPEPLFGQDFASAVDIRGPSESTLGSGSSLFQPGLPSGGAINFGNGNRASQVSGRVGDARFNSLQNNNALVLASNVFNSDATETILALNAVGAVAYRRTSNPSIIERILFKTTNDGAIEFNDQGEPVIQSVEQIQASLVEFLPAQELKAEQVVPGRSPASVDTGAALSEQRVERSPIRYFQLEQILLESMNEKP